MSLLKELLAMSEAIEVAQNPGAKDLFASIKDMLEDGEADLKKHEGKADSYSTGGNFRAQVSGDVRIRANYIKHGAYNSTSKWDLALTVGNNLQGKKALDEVKSIYERALEEAKNHEPKKLTEHSDVFHAAFDDGTISCTYDYGSAFCVVAVRKT